MRIINQHIIWLNKSLEFSVICKPEYATKEVSLFSFGTKQLYPQKDYLIENKLFIEHISQIISQKKKDEVYEFFGFQHELFIKVNFEETYAEKWGFSTTVSTEDFLGIFYSIQSFLESWNDRQKLTQLITESFEEIKNSKHDINTVFIKKINSTDQLKMILSEEELAMSAEAYLKTINWPMHLENPIEEPIENTLASANNQSAVLQETISEKYKKGYFLSSPKDFEEYHGGNKHTEKHFTAYKLYDNGIVAKRFKINDDSYILADFDTVKYKGTFKLFPKTIEFTFPKGKEHFEIEILTVVDPNTLLDKDLREYKFVPLDEFNTKEIS